MCLCAYLSCSWQPLPTGSNAMPHLFIIVATPQLNVCPSRPACCERFLPLSTQADVAGLSTFQCLESLQKPIHAHSQQQVAVGPTTTTPEVLCPASLRTMHCVELVDRVHVCVHGRVGVADGGTTRCACLVAGCSARGSCSTLRGLAGGSMHHGHGDVCQHACVCVHLCAVCE